MFVDYIKTLVTERIPKLDPRINELEFRIGKNIDGSFISGCSQSEFRSIIKDYKNKWAIIPDHSYLLNIYTEGNRIRLKYPSVKGILEYINSGEVITNSTINEVVKKHKIMTDDIYNNYYLRVSAAYEENIDISIDVLDNNISKVYRYTERWSYQIYDGISIDLSIVKQGTGKSFKDVLPKMLPEKYEVELDISKYDIDDEMIKIINMHLTNILLILYGGINIQDSKILSEFWHKYSNKYDPRIFAQNIPMTNEILKEVNKDDLVFDDKADGERYMLFIDETGISVLISGKEKVLWTGLVLLPHANSLFDGELIMNNTTGEVEFHVFDVLYYNDKDVRDLPFYNSAHFSIYDCDEETKKLKLSDVVKQKRYKYYKKRPEKVEKISLKDKKELIEINEFSPKNKRKIKYERREVMPSDEQVCRYLIIISAFSSEIINKNFTIKPKNFYPLNMIVFLNKYDILTIDEEAQVLSKNKFYELDGLIVQDKNGKYPKQTRRGVNPQWNNSYKWKFPISITIDFEIIFKETLVDERICLLRGGAYDIQQNFKVIDGKLKTISGDVVSNKAIIECGKDASGLWIIYKLRPDKVKPNSMHTIMTTLELIEDPVSIISLT